MPLELKKLKLVLTHHDSKIQIAGNPYNNVRAVKVRYLSYATASTGNVSMEIICKEFMDNGLSVDANGISTPYFLSVPLDPQMQVTCLYDNYNANEYDVYLKTPMTNLNDLSFKIFINDAGATDITPSNPLVMELGIYLEI